MQSITYPFQDRSLPLQARVQDLVSRFTREEKTELMLQYQPAVERLGVKPYKHGTEAAHGIAWLGEATSFPQPTGLACTWNPELLKSIGSAIGDEARVFYQRNPAVNELTLWAPTVDMERDPRWGRNEEAYGEDPHLTGELTAALVQGVQGDHPVYLKAVSTLKHFLGNNNEINRGSCSASIDPRNMKEYYEPAFKPAFVKGGALSMMTSYNSINGTPAILHEDVNAVVKGEWGMDGFIVSDAGDLAGLVQDHGYYRTYKEAVAHAVKAGIDSITDDKEICLQALREALQEGLLTEADLDRALCRTFSVRFRLGEFDPDEGNPYANMPESVLMSPEHAALSLRAARESVVLLQNNGLLPLDKSKLKQVAVIGPLGDAVLRDWYSGTLPYKVTPLEGIRRKLAEAGGQVIFRDGNDRIVLRTAKDGAAVCLSGEEHHLAAIAGTAQPEVFEAADWGWNSFTLKAASNGKFAASADDIRMTASSGEVFGWFVKEVFRFLPQDNGQVALSTWNGKLIRAGGEEENGGLFVSKAAAAGTEELFIKDVLVNGLEEAVAAAWSSEMALVFVGNHPLINGKEEIDRPDITLPEAQQELIRRVAEVNPNTVVVIIGSYPFALNGLEERVSSVLYLSHAGQELGTAIADVLFGDYNPAGRLNMTWYRSVEQLTGIMDYDIIEGKRTYQYFDGEPLFPFGHGLSYTSFEYDSLQVAESEKGAEIRIRVTNTGARAGDEVAQLYVRATASRVKRPFKQLKGFTRVHLEPGESRTLLFPLPKEELAFWDVTRGKYCVETGEYRIMVGRSSADIAAETVWAVQGETVPARDLSVPTFAHHYDGYAGVFLDESKEGGSCIRPAAGSGWIRFKDADGTGLRDGIGTFRARVSGGLNGGRIEIRLDGPEGWAAGICAVPPTGGSQAWCTVPCSVEGFAGIRDVYLLIRGDIAVSKFQIV